MPLCHGSNISHWQARDSIEICFVAGNDPYVSFSLNMASTSEYVSNPLIPTKKSAEITCLEKDPPAIELRISLKHFTTLVQGGIFGENPASNALRRNLQSYASYIAHSQQQYKLEVTRRQVEERLRKQEEILRKQEEAARQLAEQRVDNLQQELAVLRFILSENNSAGGNLLYPGNPDGQWQVQDGSNHQYA